MKTSRFFNRLPSAIGSGLLGSIGGALLAAFGQVIGSSVFGVTAAVTVGLCCGAFSGRLTGVAIGAMCGGLAAAFGSVIGGTHLDVTLTIVACALLAGWLDWTQPQQSDADDFQDFIAQKSEGIQRSFRLSPANQKTSLRLRKGVPTCL